MKNTPYRIAEWFTGREPAVIYVDQFYVDAMKRSGIQVKVPSSPGHWWGADDGWTGPFNTREEALTDGRKAIQLHRNQRSR